MNTCNAHIAMARWVRRRCARKDAELAIGGTPAVAIRSQMIPLRTENMSVD
jgi:hypothetical protein